MSKKVKRNVHKTKRYWFWFCLAKQFIILQIQRHHKNVIVLDILWQTETVVTNSATVQERSVPQPEDEKCETCINETKSE